MSIVTSVDAYWLAELGSKFFSGEHPSFLSLLGDVLGG